MELYRKQKRDRERESERGRKLAPVDISSFLIILFHVAKQDSLDMGVMVIMGIYNSFLQSSRCCYITWMIREVFFSCWTADRSDFDLVQFVDYLPVQSSFLCTCVDEKPARVCMYTHGCVCFGVHVCVFSLAPLVGLGVPRFDRARLWVMAFGPHLPGSRNLSCNLLRQWGEHVKPWHMVARVTCSLCLSLIFRPTEQTCPTQRDTCTAPPALCFGKHP